MAQEMRGMRHGMNLGIPEQGKPPARGVFVVGGSFHFSFPAGEPASSAVFQFCAQVESDFWSGLTSYRSPPFGVEPPASKPRTQLSCRWKAEQPSGGFWFVALPEVMDLKHFGFGPCGKQNVWMFV